MAVERKKDGIVEATLEGARQNGVYYEVRYVTDSVERGKKRYLSRFAVAGELLHVFTVEGYVRYWDADVDGIAGRMLGTFEVIGAS